MFDLYSIGKKGCHLPNGRSAVLKLGSVELLNSFIVRYFREAMKTRSLQYDIEYIKAEVSRIDVENLFTALKYHRQVNHQKS